MEPFHVEIQPGGPNYSSSHEGEEFIVVHSKLTFCWIGRRSAIFQSILLTQAKNAGEIALRPFSE